MSLAPAALPVRGDSHLSEVGDVGLVTGSTPVVRPSTGAPTAMRSDSPYTNRTGVETDPRSKSQSRSHDRLSREMPDGVTIARGKSASNARFSSG
jgi:hypothetical protein